MNQDKEWIGEWYIPVKDEIVVFYGTLKFSKRNGSILKISSNRNFEENVLSYESIIDDEYEIISGIEHKTSSSLTLYKCNRRLTSTRVGIEVTVDIGFIFEDLEYINEESLNFKSIQFQLSGLGEWLRTRGIKVDHRRQPSNRHLRIDYYKPESLKFVIDDYYDIEIMFSYTTGGSYNRFEFVFTEVFFGSIVSKSIDTSFDELFRLLEIYRRLMSVLMDYECFPMELRSFKSNQSDENSKYEKLDGYKVYYKPPFDDYPEDKVTWIDMNFTYEDISYEFESILKKWFSYKDKDDMDYVHWILSKNSKTFSEDHFLSYARALEVFHRVEGKNNLLFTKNKKNALIDKLLSNINFEDLYDDNAIKTQEDYNLVIKKIKSNLSYINEPTFRERLKSIVEEIRKISDPALYEKVFKNSDNLIKETVKKRNYYTHYGSSSEELYDNKKYFKEILNLSKMSVYLKDLLLIVVSVNHGIPVNLILSKIINGKNTNYYSEEENK